MAPTTLLTLLLSGVQQGPTHVLVRDTTYSAVAAAPGAVGFISEGRVIVTHAAEGTATELTRSGARQIGRRGDGPGEFRRPSYAGYWRDTLWIADAVARRITTFTPEPAVYSAHLDGMNASPRAYVGNAAILITARAPTDNGRTRLVRIQNGSAVTLATVAASRSVEVMFGSTIDDGALRMVHPLSPHPRFGVDVERGRLLIVDRADTDQYVIRWLDLLTGAAIAQRSYRVERKRAADTVQRLADWWWYRLGANSRATEERFKERFVQAVGEGIPFLPAAGEVLVSPNGAVWVERAPRSPLETSRWTIHLADGRVDGTVDLPPRHALLAVDGDHALVLEDEATAVVYRAVRNPQRSAFGGFLDGDE